MVFSLRKELAAFIRPEYDVAFPWSLFLSRSTNDLRVFFFFPFKNDRETRRDKFSFNRSFNSSCCVTFRDRFLRRTILENNRRTYVRLFLKHFWNVRDGKGNERYRGNFDKEILVKDVIHRAWARTIECNFAQVCHRDLSLIMDKVSKLLNSVSKSRHLSWVTRSLIIIASIVYQHFSTSRYKLWVDGDWKYCTNVSLKREIKTESLVSRFKSKV